MSTEIIPQNVINVSHSVKYCTSFTSLKYRVEDIAGSIADKFNVSCQFDEHPLDPVLSSGNGPSEKTYTVGFASQAAEGDERARHNLCSAITLLQHELSKINGITLEQSHGG